VDSIPAKTTTDYDITFCFLSKSRRVAQRALNAWIFLIDDEGRRHPPLSDPSLVPLDVRLQPQQAIRTHRVFRVPRELQRLGLSTGHGGSYCNAMGCFIIGGWSCRFNKPDIVRIVPAGAL
jgi:hypothetical protein